jgi:hypothetical protein
MAKTKQCWMRFISVFQQMRAFQRGEKIFFHTRKTFSGDGIPRDQNQFDRLRQFVLMQPETFAQQTPGAIAFHSTADFFAGDDAQLWRRAVRQFVPIGDQTAEREALPDLPHAREITALLKTRLAAQGQAFRRVGVHEIKPA